MSGHFVESEANATYNRKVNTRMYLVARTAPLLPAVFAVGVALKLVEPSEFFSWQILVLSVISIIIVAARQKNTYYQPPLQHVSFYLVALTIIVFIMGLEYMAMAWVVLSISTFLNYNIKAYYWTYALLVPFVILDFVLMWPILGAPRMYFDLMILIFTFWSTTIVVKVIEAQTLDHDRLVKTRRREISQVNRMQALINSLSDAIISFDNKGIIKLYNSAALSLLDTNKSLTGLHIDDVVRLHSKNASKNQRVSLFKKSSSEKHQLETEDYLHQFEDGESIRLSIVSAPIRNPYGKDRPSEEGQIVILRDITKSKSLEEERDEFISVLSHELRTPIAITEGSLSNTAFFAQKEKASPEILKGLGDAHEQVVYLAKMINDLTALSRAERNVGLGLENLDVDKFMHDLYNQYSQTAKASGLTMNLDIDGTVGSFETSKLYLEELLQNLITNAIKYTANGGVTLIAKRDPKGVYFAVKDTGHGISKTDQNRVFEKFYRSEDYRTRETGGTGLGLYVAGKLSNKLGTRIDLESRLNHGSTFSFVLPDAKSPDLSAKPL